MLVAPHQFSAPGYDALRRQLPWWGITCCLAGAGLLAACVFALPRWLRLVTHVAAALALALLALGLALTGIWGSTLGYALLALGTGAAGFAPPGRATLDLRLPAPPGAPRRSYARAGRPAAPLSSLRARLALALAGAAALPLILAAVVIARQEAQSAIDEALVQQQTMAGVLAQDAAQYIGLHRSAVAALAGQLALLEPEPATQTVPLRTVGEAYPAFVFLGTFDAEGRGKARGQGRPPPPSARFPIFDEVRRTGAPAIDVLNRPELAQGPVFALAAPIFQGERSAGVVLGAVESTQLSAVLARPRVGAGGETYLVDARGRAVAHPDTALVAALADLSGLPPVAAVLGEDGEPQALRYHGSSGERLAGAARVPGLGWGIVVERPISTVLADSYARRDIIFVVLVFAIAAAAGGARAAGKLTPALAVLADEVIGVWTTRGWSVCCTTCWGTP
jgi:hypothetical protein